MKQIEIQPDDPDYQAYKDFIQQSHRSQNKSIESEASQQPNPVVKIMPNDELLKNSLSNSNDKVESSFARNNGTIEEGGGNTSKKSQNLSFSFASRQNVINYAPQSK